MYVQLKSICGKPQRTVLSPFLVPDFQMTLLLLTVSPIDIEKLAKFWEWKLPKKRIHKKLFSIIDSPSYHMHGSQIDHRHSLPKDEGLSVTIDPFYLPIRLSNLSLFRHLKDFGILKIYTSTATL